MGKECKENKCKNTPKKGHAYCGLHSKKTTTVAAKTTWSKPCHTGNVLVGSPQGVNIYAGGSSRSGGWWRMLPYPDLAIGPDEIVCDRGPKPIDPRWADAKSSSYLTESTPIILGIDWPDFGLPKGTDGQNMPADFWYALVEDILDKGIKTVSTQCMGGHGRTGVQLGILLHLLTPEEERTWTDLAGLLAHIHEVYCKNAVEGDNQAKYIAEVCELEEGDYKLHHARATAYGGSNVYLGGHYGGLGGNVWGGGGAWTEQCEECKQYVPKAECEGGICDDCYSDRLDAKIDSATKEKTEDVVVEDEVPFEGKCDSCDEIYDWDIGICEVCTIGQVLPIPQTKQDEEAWEELGLIKTGEEINEQ